MLMKQTQFARHSTARGWHVPIYGAPACLQIQNSRKDQFLPKEPLAEWRGREKPSPLPWDVTGAAADTAEP